MFFSCAFRNRYLKLVVFKKQNKTELTFLLFCNFCVYFTCILLLRYHVNCVCINKLKYNKSLKTVYILFCRIKLMYNLTYRRLTLLYCPHYRKRTISIFFQWRLNKTLNVNICIGVANILHLRGDRTLIVRFFNNMRVVIE